MFDLPSRREARLSGRLAVLETLLAVPDAPAITLAALAADAAACRRQLARLAAWRQRRAALTGRPRCRHCGERVAARPRGLCFSCYCTPGVREQYPSTSKFVRRGSGITNRRLPCKPTSALPGTPEKLAVLEARAAAGQQLFHAADARHGVQRAA